MFFHSRRSLLSLTLLATTSAYTPASTHGSDLLAAHSLANLEQVVANGELKAYLATQNVSQQCTAENIAVRRE